jgi:hypothetical protein
VRKSKYRLLEEEWALRCSLMEMRCILQIDITQRESSLLSIFGL